MNIIYRLKILLFIPYIILFFPLLVLFGITKTWSIGDWIIDIDYYE